MADKVHPKSLRNVKVATTVQPKDGKVDDERAERIAKSLKKEIKETLKQNADKPSGEQAGKAIEKARERKEEMDADGTKVDVGVVIVGTRGEDGEEEVHMHGTGELAKDVADDSSFEDEDG